LKNKELVRNSEAETDKKIRNFRLKAKHKVPYKKKNVSFSYIFGPKFDMLNFVDTCYF